MARQVVRIRTYRVNGPRKSRNLMQMRPVVVFVVLNLVAAFLGTMIVLVPDWRQAAVVAGADGHQLGRGRSEHLHLLNAKAGNVPIIQ